jgi:phosphoribosylaminoimidazolecarboxamide formyltransferase/IMP cyclohydrolase
MRALLAVSNKDGIVEFAKGLSQYDCYLISTTGTSALLSSANLMSKTVDELTGSPDLLGGRVKTFYPEIFGGILFIRGNQNHENEVFKNKLVPIDIVVCNFYPFASKAETFKSNLESAQDYIDIGGPALIRAAAKNFQHVLPIVDPLDYLPTLRHLSLCKGDLKAVPFEFRLELAKKAFQYTANYDLSILRYYSNLV